MAKNKTVEKSKQDKQSGRQQDTFNMEEEYIIGISKREDRTKKVPVPEKTETRTKKAKNKKKSHATNQNRKLTKKQKQQLKRRKRILKILKWFMLFSIIFGGLICFLLSPLFHIAQVQVVGNEKLTYEQILSLSQINLGENTFKMSKNVTIQNLKENAYIESVKIHRKLPDTVQIEIKERKASFMIAYVNSYIYLNNQGYCLEISDTKLDLPILTGYVTEEENLKPGNRLVKEDLEQLGIVLQMVDALNSIEAMNLVTSIDIAVQKDIKLWLETENKLVHIGDTSDLSTKMLYLKVMIEKESGKAGSIILNEGWERARFRENINS